VPGDYVRTMSGRIGKVKDVVHDYDGKYYELELQNGDICLQSENKISFKVRIF
jgi:preprotein translocase subunit YajC